MTTQKVRAMPVWKRLLFTATFGLVSSRQLRAMPIWKRILLGAVLGFAVVLLYRTIRAELHGNLFMEVGLSGTHHLGPNFNIAGFYVNGNYESNIGREGDGGDMCCVLLPKKWRPGLVVEVRWAVGDWSKESRPEIDAGNYKSITYSCFKALVPVEKYVTAGRVFIHFFAEGKVRAVTAFAGPGNLEHPILNDDPHAGNSATVGQRVDAIFSDAETKEMLQRHENRNNFFGNWH
jgi:hypothetical protein